MVAIPVGDGGANKRRRVHLASTTAAADGDAEPVWAAVGFPSMDFQARCGLQRSIAMVLQHVGFDSATPEAMESFTAVVETCEQL